MNVRQRDPDAHGDGDRVRPTEIDGSQHGGGPDLVGAVRSTSLKSAGVRGHVRESGVGFPDAGTLISDKVT